MIGGLNLSLFYIAALAVAALTSMFLSSRDGMGS
jgi:hypothetical protein